VAVLFARFPVPQPTRLLMVQKADGPNDLFDPDF